jgi:hypothetical protein
MERQFAGRLQTARDSVVGFIDEGGVARAVGDPTIRLGETSAKVQRLTSVEIEVRGRFVSTEGTPIGGALVAVAELDTVLTAGADGTFQLSRLPPGPLRLRVRAIGYAPLGVALSLSAERRLVDTTFTLTRVAQPLDSVVVTAPGFRAGKLEDFERRRKSGFGKFFTRAELHDPNESRLDLQFRKVGRIRIVPIPWQCGGGYAAAATTATGHTAADGVVRDCSARPPQIVPACYLSVYLDGALHYSIDMKVVPPDLSKLNPLTLEAAEIYVSAAEIPAEYNATGSACGVILLWTRVG